MSQDNALPHTCTHTHMYILLQGSQRTVLIQHYTYPPLIFPSQYSCLHYEDNHLPETCPSLMPQLPESNLVFNEIPT